MITLTLEEVAQLAAGRVLRRRPDGSPSAAEDAHVSDHEVIQIRLSPEAVCALREQWGRAEVPRDGQDIARAPEMSSCSGDAFQALLDQQEREERFDVMGGYFRTP